MKINTTQVDMVDYVQSPHRGKRVKITGKYMKSPFVPLPDTTPLAKPDKKKKRVVSSVHKLTIGDSTEDEVAMWNENFIRQNGDSKVPMMDIAFDAWLFSERSKRVTVSFREKLSCPRRFWYTLLCRDCPKDDNPGGERTESGWLDDTHIRLWVDYLNTLRPADADWCAIDPLFLSLLMIDDFELSTYFSDGVMFPGKWEDVSRVYFPANQPEVHFCLMELEIVTGVFTYYDSLMYVDSHGTLRRDDYWTRLEEKIVNRLPEFLDTSGVFERRGINKDAYNIKFRTHPKNLTPQQAGGFGDCGIFVCMFLYRLAFHKPLLRDVDPRHAGLWYRESNARLFYEHVDPM